VPALPRTPWAAVLVFSHRVRMLKIIQAYVDRERVRRATLLAASGSPAAHAASRPPPRQRAGALAHQADPCAAACRCPPLPPLPYISISISISISRPPACQYDYLYLDGSVTGKRRQEAVDEFNTRWASRAAPCAAKSAPPFPLLCASTLERPCAPRACLQRAPAPSSSPRCRRRPFPRRHPLLQAQRIPVPAVHRRRRRRAQPDRREPRGGV
jgi:hypothetical protein